MDTLHIKLFFAVLGILVVLCVYALWRITKLEKADSVERALPDLDISEITTDEEPGGFWNAANQTPVRDIPFTAEERALARMRETETAGEIETVVEVETVNTEKPRFDYPNVDGFPCEGKTFDDFSLAMMTHGFVIRFIMASKEVMVVYSGPAVRDPMDALRRTYRPPLEIYPVNLLHDEGRIQTALWTMRRFKRDEKLPELDAYAYL